ncbi:Xylose isomerase domain protein TIM barrel [Methanocaldococcus lauensis]|nr:Xylose isomerase domain protein TIM barrel [Methanocaldococcus lauensis]
MLIFGTAGVPISAEDEFKGVDVLRKLNLGAMELEFVKGVYMKEDYAKKLKEYGKDIVFSAHAPHFINLNANEEYKIKNSIERIIKTAKVLNNCGRNLVFHPGYYLKKSKETTYNIIKSNIQKILEKLELLNLNIMLRPETSGRVSQFGDVDETLNLCYDLNLLPCIDFAHIYARSRGRINNYDSFCKILEKVENMLGKNAIKDMHIHLSGIEYGKGGERRHLPLKESNFNYKDALKALKDFNTSGTVICESPLLEYDTVLLMKCYNEL